MASLASRNGSPKKTSFASRGSSSIKEDLGTSTGLASLLTKKGLGDQVEEVVTPEPKLSFLQRLGKGLGAFNPAEAILTGEEKGIGAGLLEYPKSIIKGVGSAITGTDYEPERRGFKDVAEKAGIENDILKNGIGFVGDVLLDPTTYFGGAIAKGIGAVGKGVGSTALKGIGKIAPEAEIGLRTIGEAAKDAAGSLFKFGYKSTEGATGDILTHLSKTQRAQMELAGSNLDRLGAGVLSKSQQEQLALSLAEARRVEFDARDAVQELVPTQLLVEAKKYKSAEEFIKAHGKPLYHGTTAKGIEGISKDGFQVQLGRESFNKSTGISITSDTKSASRFTGKDGKILDVYIDPNAKLFDGDIFKTLVQKEYNGPQLRGEELAEAKVAKNLKEQGYDGIDFRGRKTSENYEQEVRIWNTDKIKTKSQLTDTWNEAQSSTDTSSVALARINAISDPVVRKTALEQLQRTKEFAKMANVENPYEVYYPFIRKDKLAKFVRETNSQGIKVGSEGYRKQFKNLLTNENLELNPAKAYFTRESQIVTDKMNREFLNDFVKKYGKGLDEFKNADEAFANGYDIIKEKGKFGKEIGYVPKWDAKLIKDSLNPEYQAISMLAKNTGFDAITSLFKRSVTGLFPSFHVRNFASGIIQNFETLGKDALNPLTIASGMKVAKYMAEGGKNIPEGIMNVAGKDMKLKDVIQPLIDRFAGDTFYSADFDLALKNGEQLKQAAGILTKGRALETLKTAGLGQEAIPFRVARGVGQFIEHQQKATAYLTALGQGKTIPEALNLAEKAGFDYRALTSFESQIMRRIIPFYSFTRKNIELQLRTLGETPERINQILKTFENVGDQPTAEEKKNLPDYIKESLGIKWSDTPEGIKQYITNFGTPVEAFSTLFGKNPVLRGISMMNPLLKAPIELGIGKDSFRQQDLKEVYDAREYKMAPQFIKDFLKLKEVQQDVLKKGPLGKLVKTGTRAQYVADPERLLVMRSLFTARGFSYLDQVFGGDLQGMAKLLKTTTGIKPNQVNEEYQKALQEKQKRRALEDIGTRYNIIEQFSRNYVPKGRQ